MQDLLCNPFFAIGMGLYLSFGVISIIVIDQDTFFFYDIKKGRWRIFFGVLVVIFYPIIGLVLFVDLLIKQVKDIDR